MILLKKVANRRTGHEKALQRSTEWHALGRDGSFFFVVPLLQMLGEMKGGLMIPDWFL